MANKRHKPKAKPAKRSRQSQSIASYDVAHRPNQRTRSGSESPPTFWSFFWSLFGWGFVGCLIGGAFIVAFFIGLALLDGFDDPVAAYSIPETALLLVAAIPFFAPAGWIVASFSLRALNPVTGPIRNWKELGALSSTLFGLVLCQAIAANGGMRGMSTNPYLGFALSLALVLLTWWVLSTQFDTANVWLAVTLAGSILYRSFTMLPDVISENPLLSLGINCGMSLLGAWAFWAMMQAAKNGTTFHGFWPQRAT